MTDGHTSGPIVVVANPAGGGADQLDEVRAALDRGSLDYSWVETTEDDPGIGQTRAAVDDGAALIIAAGGDGTVRACLEGLTGSSVPLGVVPLGTGNLLARNLDIPLHPSRAIEVAVRGQTQAMDLGVVNGEVFGVMSGTGLDAEMMTAADDTLKASVGPLAYVVAGLRRMRSASFECDVQVDGATSRHSAGMVLIGNSGRLPGGLDAFPDARVDDGRLHGVVVEAQTVWGWLTSSAALLAGKDDSSSIHRFQGSSVTVTPSNPRTYELDGEERDVADSLEYSIRPGAVRVRVNGKDES